LSFHVNSEDQQRHHPDRIPHAEETEQRKRAKETYPDAMPEIPRPRLMKDCRPRFRALPQTNQEIRSPEHVEAIKRKLQPGVYLDHATPAASFCRYVSLKQKQAALAR
jgi:hypothetical protein